MRFTHISLSIALLCLSCGGNNSKEAPNGKQEPSKELPKEQPKTSPNAPLTENMQFIDLDINKLKAGTTLNIDGNKQNVAYRFTFPRRGVLEKNSHSSIVACDGDSEVALTVRRVVDSNAVEAQALANVFEKYSIDLEAGTYAIVVSKAAGVSCSNVAITLGIRAKISAAPAPSPNPTPVPTPTTNPTPTPTSRPVDPEEARIRNRELKDTAGISFIAYVSESEGCVPVFTRTVGELKKSFGLNPQIEMGPVRFVASREPGTSSSHYSIEMNVAGMVFQLLEFEDGLVPAQPLWMMEKTLINNSDVTLVSINAACATALTVFDGANPSGFPDLPLWTTTDKLPFKAAGNYPDAKFTYRTEAGKESLNIKLGVNVSKLLGDLGVVASDVTSVEWMLGRSRPSGRYPNSYPLSDWQPLNLSGFLSGNINIDAGSLAARGIDSFRYSALAVRVKTKNISNSDKKYVLPVGSLCAAAYSRTDGAAYHNALFNDLTHPEWNNSPSTAQKTGCGFVGAK